MAEPKISEETIARWKKIADHEASLQRMREEDKKREVEAREKMRAQGRKLAQVREDDEANSPTEPV